MLVKKRHYFMSLGKALLHSFITTGGKGGGIYVVMVGVGDEQEVFAFLVPS